MSQSHESAPGTDPQKVQIGPDAEQLSRDPEATPRTYSDWLERVRAREYERTVREEDLRRQGIDPEAIPEPIKNYYQLLGELAAAQEVLMAMAADLGIRRLENEPES